MVNPNDQESNEQRSASTNVFDNTYDQMLDWSPPNPTLLQRTYSEEDLNNYLADLDQSDDDQSPRNQNPFIVDEAEDVELESFIVSCDDDERRGSPDTQSSHSSDIQVIAQYTEDERNLLSDVERYVDFGGDEEPKKRRKEKNSESDCEQKPHNCSSNLSFMIAQVSLFCLLYYTLSGFKSFARYRFCFNFVV